MRSKYDFGKTKKQKQQQQQNLTSNLQTNKTVCFADV